MSNLSLRKKIGYLWFGILMALLVIVISACGSTTGGSNSPTPGSGSAKISLKELNLGLIPAENATQVMDNTLPFSKALEKELGVKVNLFVAPNYTGTIEALQSKKIDVAWFGPFSYVLASAKYNAEVFVQQVYPNGDDHYFSYLITTPKTGIKTINDLKGKTFSFVDPASTSGNLIPRYMLTKAGLDPDKDVKGIFAGGHDASLLGVLSGKVDAGAVASDTFATMQSQGKFKDGDFVIVAKSDPIPSSPIAYRKELSQSDKDAIKAAFQAVKDPEALKAANVSGFKVTTDSTYDGLRDVARQLNLDLNKLK